MVQIAVSLGSNIERESNIRMAARAIRSRYPEATFSPVFSSAAVGFDGPDFLNLVAVYESDLPVMEVIRELHDWEDHLGRKRMAGEMTSRTIDLDLLLYGDETFHPMGLNVPRDEILEYAHVLKPLSIVIPQQRHPVTGETYQTLWTQMSAEQDASLKEVSLQL